MKTAQRTITFLLCLLCMLQSSSSWASHIFGMDLYYTWVTGRNYNIQLVVYADCSGAAFYTLASSRPTVNVYNGSTYVTSTNLNLQPPTSGLEITPVCPAQLGNTQCTNISNPLPGVKKFVYSGNVSLASASTQWRFVFSGDMGGSSSAGRSSSITNIYLGSSGAPIQLVDTLNNATYSNNSNALFTATPTPFVCISTATNLNTGSVDPNGDSLVYDLVPAIDASTGVGVSYVWPYSATAPFAAVSGSYSFSQATGQISFTPSAVQKSLVVYNVREFRGGTLVGTCQREMTVVVLGSCSNNPPTGAISGASGGSILASNRISVCNNLDTFLFNINPTDADGDSITMVASGLPAGATFNIVNNNTRAPLGTFGWRSRGITPGSYTFYITYTDNGCPITSRQVVAYTIVVLPTPTASVRLTSLATCTRPATFTITPGGSASPWTVALIRGSTTVHLFTAVTGVVNDSLPPGSYTVRIFSPDNCFRDTLLVIPNTPAPSALITTSLPVCVGDSNGTISVIGTGGTSPYSYAIGSGTYSATNTFTSLPAGTYPLHIRDTNNCTLDTSISLPNPSPILLRIQRTQPTCNGYATGRVILAAYNSVGPYTYAQGSGGYSASDTFRALTAGTYTFHIRNALGCIIDTTIVLRDSVQLRGTVSIAPIRCNGGTATLTLTASGGFSSSYNYAYNTGAYGPFNVFTLSAGTYVLHMRDTALCTFDTTITLTQPAPITLGSSLTPARCFGTATGAILLTGGGGTPRYYYALNGGTFDTTRRFNTLPASRYGIAIRDTNGCTLVDSVTITQPSRISFDSIRFSLPICARDSNGIINIIASGGTPPYTYAINSGSYGTSRRFTGLPAASYVLHIRDSLGCQLDSTFMLADAPPLSLTVSLTPPRCAGVANGSITLTASSGTPGYRYALGSSGYTTAQTYDSLSAGTYTASVLDTLGCRLDSTLVLPNAGSIRTHIITIPPLCYGDSNGHIIMAGMGGTAPYSYTLDTTSWSLADTLHHLPDGLYHTYTRDSMGCRSDTIVRLAQPQPISATITPTMPTCFGYQDGRLNILARGGVGHYSYAIGTSAYRTLAVFDSLGAGTYILHIRDSFGCQKDSTITLSQPSPITVATLTATSVLCYGGSSGAITIIGAGGTPSYTYSLGSGAYQISTLFTGLVMGSYPVHIKDANGCILDTGISVNQPPKLSFTGVMLAHPKCEGDTNGHVLLLPTGGTMPYAYSIDNINFRSNPFFSFLREGSYTFYVKDTNNCTLDTTITLIGLPHVRFDSIGLQQPLCAGNSNGAISLYMASGVAPFRYNINTSHTTPAPNVLGGLVAGEYILTAIDSNECRFDTAIHLTEPEELLIIPHTTPNDCIGADNTGTINAIIFGGTAPYRYFWSIDTFSGPIVTGLANGLYSLQVQDTNKCADTAIMRIAYDNCCTPSIPNAFSPNGDGINDYFKLLFKGDVRIIDFFVYNRFGERIFATAYSYDSWDGTYGNQPCEMGVYYFYLRFICGTEGDKVIELKGDVTLVR